MRGAIGEIVAAPGGLDFIERLLDEVVTVIGTVGETPSEAHLATVRRMLTEPGSSLTSSMYRDLSQGAPIEADQILGDLLARAQAADLSTPLLATAYASLAIYQRRLAGKQA
jgi:2-dehydropantoate 2-reductase